MGRTLFAFLSISFSIVGAIAIVASNAISMLIDGSVPAAWQFWGLVLFLIGVTFPVILSEIEQIYSPRIQLGTWAIEPSKRMFETETRRILFWDRIHRIEYRFQAAFLEVYIRPRLGNKTVERVMPRVVWLNRNGETVTQNNGRWWLSHPNVYVDTSELQMVNLWPNGQQRRLYLARHQAGQLLVWHRTYDNKEAVEPVAHGDYEVRVELNPANSRKAEYRFVLTSIPTGMSIERLTSLDRFRRWFRRR